MNKKLVFDIGMHKGEDTDFYLQRGFKVVGVEANPELVAKLQDRFATAINRGDLVIIGKAIAETDGKIEFHFNDEHSVWGSTHPAFVTRNAELGSISTRVIAVESMTLAQLIEEFSDPYYVKIDIEGMDLTALRSLAGTSCRPRYVSLESAVSGPVGDWREELSVLSDLGYTRFKYVDQASLTGLDGKLLEGEGRPLVYRHQKDASGPFGEEAPGRWLSYEEARARGFLLRTNFLLFSKMSSAPPFLTSMARSLRGLAGFSNSFSWYDLHAAFPGTSSGTR